MWLNQLGVALSFQRQDSSDSLPIQTGFVVEKIFGFCVNKAISSKLSSTVISSVQKQSAQCGVLIGLLGLVSAPDSVQANSNTI
ncbi:MAG: hypothetical protein AB2735_11955 [Candidatus Thiodiazotropha taylori]|nr:hypothetical protein [Candidatus Thiodiazotropha taylori]